MHACFAGVERLKSENKNMALQLHEKGHVVIDLPPRAVVAHTTEKDESGSEPSFFSRISSGSVGEWSQMSMHGH